MRSFLALATALLLCGRVADAGSGCITIDAHGTTGRPTGFDRTPDMKRGFSFNRVLGYEQRTTYEPVTSYEYQGSGYIPITQFRVKTYYVPVYEKERPGMSGEVLTAL